MPSSVLARDVFLTIGGGYSPTGNQVSLEKNVELFSTYLAESYEAPVEHYVFFSDGDDEGRDLQYIADDFPRANELVATVFNQDSNLKYRYRNHHLGEVQGGSNKQSITDWFQKQGSGLAAGDRLIVYVTAHGGKAQREEDPQNSRLHLWNGESVDVAEFRRWLDCIDPQVPIAVVMVQCYSGGFANLIFDEPISEDQAATLSRPWCGFFATVHDRVAAGCTADTKEENYHEYTTYLMEALRGETRLGDPVAQPDFDENGMITLDEAHAYALIQSKTIDISIKTSDRFLRTLQFPETDSLVSRDAPLETLAAHASLNQQQIVDELSRELGLVQSERCEAARRLADQLRDQKKAKEREVRQQRGQVRSAAGQIRQTLVHRWPELLNAWNPSAQQILRDEAESVVGAVEQHPRFANFMDATQKLEKLSTEATDLERQWVKCQRLIYTLESLACQANLATQGRLEDQEHYARLLRLESMVLGSLGEGWEPNAVSSVAPRSP